MHVHKCQWTGFKTWQTWTFFRWRTSTHTNSASASSSDSSVLADFFDSTLIVSARHLHTVSTQRDLSCMMFYIITVVQIDHKHEIWGRREH